MSTNILGAITNHFLTVRPTGQPIPRFAGIRPAVAPPVFSVDRRFLPNAYGSAPDGSDGGAFIEFKDAPTGNNKVPKYATFQDQNVAIEYGRYWFDNAAHRNNNMLHLLVADKVDCFEAGSTTAMKPAGFTYARESTCFVFNGHKHNDMQIESTTAHEIGHRFNLANNTDTRFSHIDDNLGALSHDGSNKCLMSYDRDRVTSGAQHEFCVDCLLNGSSPGREQDSLRDRNDH